MHQYLYWTNIQHAGVEMANIPPYLSYGFLFLHLSRGFLLLQLKNKIQEFNTLWPRQNDRHTPDIFKWIFQNENLWISIQVSLKFVPRGPINYIPALVQIMAWGRSGNKPLSEPMMVNLLTYIHLSASMSHGKKSHSHHHGIKVTQAHDIHLKEDTIWHHYNMNNFLQNTKTDT